MSRKMHDHVSGSILKTSYPGNTCSFCLLCHTEHKPFESTQHSQICRLNSVDAVWSWLLPWDGRLLTAVGSDATCFRKLPPTVAVLPQSLWVSGSPGGVVKALGDTYVCVSDWEAPSAFFEQGQRCGLSTTNEKHDHARLRSPTMYGCR